MCRFFLYAFYVALTVVYALWAGKDVNWDLLNYHWYSGLAFENDRSAQDFMPASMQSYLNPLANLPFFYLNKWGLPAPVVGAILAAIASLNLIVLHGISRMVIPGQGWRREVLCMQGVLLGAASPIFLCELGTSFVDVLVSVPVLLSLWFVLRCVRCESRRSAYCYLFASGLAAGFALGLKLTSLLAVLAIGISAVAFSPFDRRIFYRAGAYGVGLVATFIASAGGQMMALWHQFGNPVFPFFNHIFMSPYFKAHGPVHRRFTPSDWNDFVSFPINVAGLDGYYYTEITSPDFRIFCVMVLIVLVAVVFFRRWKVGLPLSESMVRWGLNIRAATLMSMVSIMYVLWLMTSGNGRYAVPLMLLFGPVLVMLLAQFRLSPFRMTVLLGVALAAQTVSNVQAATARWGGLEWTQKWLQVEVPDNLKQNPNLYLSLQTQSLAFLANFVHPKSGFVNLIGQHTIFVNSEAWGRVDALISRYDGHVRSLYIPGSLRDGQVDVADVVATQNTLLARYGLAVADEASCELIRAPGAWGHSNMTVSGTALTAKPNTEGLAISCRVVKQAHTVADDFVFHVAASLIRQFASKCSRVIGAEPAEVEGHKGFYRSYFSDSDASVEVRLKSHSIYLYDYRGLVGSVDVNRMQDQHEVTFCRSYAKFTRAR